MGNINKSRLLYIWHILEAETDENHKLSVNDITDKLANMGIEGKRRAVLSDIELLQEFGIDIICEVGKPNRFFIGMRTLEIPELKLLIDAVQASAFVTEKKSRQLSEKLSAMASNYQAEALRRHIYSEKVVKPDNEGIYYTVDLINTAINSDKSISFQYYEYTPEKEKILKHNGKIYTVSPYGLWWDHDRYYLIGHSRAHAKVCTFRVERIEHIKMLEEERVPTADFDVSDYARQRFQMYDLPPCQMQLLCENEVMRHIIDRFGDVKTRRVDSAHFIAEVSTAPSPPFLAWIFQFNGKIKIQDPDDVKNEYVKMANMALED